MLALRTLEFDRIVDAVTALALTPLGRGGARGARAVDRSEGGRRGAARPRARRSRFLERHPLFPLRAGESLPDALDALGVAGPAARAAAAADARRLRRLGGAVARQRRSRRRARSRSSTRSSRTVAASRTKSPRCATRSIRAARCSTTPARELRRIRNELRQKRQKLRGTLEQFTRGKDTSKYLQDEVVTERNGRLRADGARRASRQRAGHRARQLGERRHAVPRAGGHGRNQQRHRRARGARARGDLPHPARADRSLSRAARRSRARSSDVATRARRAAGARRATARSVNGIEPRVHRRHQPAS